MPRKIQYKADGPVENRAILFAPENRADDVPENRCEWCGRKITHDRNWTPACSKACAEKLWKQGS